MTTWSKHEDRPIIASRLGPNGIPAAQKRRGGGIRDSIIILIRFPSTLSPSLLVLVKGVRPPRRNVRGDEIPGRVSVRVSEGYLGGEDHREQSALVVRRGRFGQVDEAVGVVVRVEDRKLELLRRVLIVETSSAAGPLRF